MIVILMSFQTIYSILIMVVHIIITSCHIAHGLIKNMRSTSKCQYLLCIDWHI
jgi:hypothetical protein